MLVKRGRGPEEWGDGILEQSYTRKGFFGTFARIGKTRDLGRPLRADRELGPFVLDPDHLTPSDLTTADGVPLALLASADATVSLSRRREPMPYCWSNADGDDLYFVHRGEARFETELGSLTAGAGDFVYLGRNIVYRVVPRTADNVFLILETRELLEPAEAYHRQHGLTNGGVDSSCFVLPELAPARNGHLVGQEYELRAKVAGQHLSAWYDFDPVGVTEGWVGDPVVFKLSAWEVPAARSPFAPPTTAAFMTEAQDCVVGIRRPVPAVGIGQSGMHVPPAHSNDWDEIWFLHSATSSPELGKLRWDPQGLTQPVPHIRPGAGPDPKRLNINFDLKRRLQLTPEAARHVMDHAAAVTSTR